MITRAISIRQPWVEQILRGEKRKEYRTKSTRIRERVYLYAALRPDQAPRVWRKLGKEPGALPSGAIVGSVEIVDCRFNPRMERYEYALAKPKRMRPRLVTNQPQPVFWRPRFR
jgi:hypothetical protein